MVNPTESFPQPITEAPGKEIEQLPVSPEVIAHFLQVFMNAADESPIDNWAQSRDFESVNYCGISQMFLKYVNSPNEVPFALLRSGLHNHRRPYVDDEIYTAVNMLTGDELHFAHSEADSIRDGNYDAERLHEMAKFGGFVEPYDTADPILSLTIDGYIMEATLETVEQMNRFERLHSLDSRPCLNARIIFAPQTAQEMRAFLRGSAMNWRPQKRSGYTSTSTELAPIVQTTNQDPTAPVLAKLIPPKDTIDLVFDDDDRYLFQEIFNMVDGWDPEMQEAVFNIIGTVDVRGLKSSWDRQYGSRTALRHAIRRDDNGDYAATPAAKLVRRIKCDKYDLLDAVWHESGGKYIESSTYTYADKKQTRKVINELDEQRARAYAEIFEYDLMPIVDTARDALHIPSNLDPADQIIMLLKQQGYVEKGMRLIEKPRVMRNRPDITVPQWAEICMIIDRCRDSIPITDDDRETIEGYGINADWIAVRWSKAPGAFTEHIAEEILEKPLYFN